MERQFPWQLVLYNKDLGELEDKIVILKAREDNNNLWLNNTEVLYSTILGNSYQNISKKEPIATYLVSSNH